MIRINYQGYVRSATALHLVHFTATGNTPGEVEADAARQIQARGLEQVSSLASHNSVADWVQAFGAPEGECTFADFRQERRS